MSTWTSVLPKAKPGSLAIAMLCIASISSSMAHLLLVPGSAGGMRQQSFDRFKKGFNAVNKDHVDQLDSNTNIAAYDRANTEAASTNTADIAAGADPLGAGAGSSGFNSKRLIGEFDRGAVMDTNTRLIDQNALTSNNAIDSGVVKSSAASEALIGGPVAGAGSSYQNLMQARDQRLANVDHVDQHLEEGMVNAEQFDRGTVAKERESSATIADGIGLGAPYGAAIGSQGMQAGQFAETRDRGLIGSKMNVVADRNENLVNQVTNKQVTAKTGANDVVLVGPAGGSAGRAAAASHLASSQGALQHADSDERRLVNAAKVKALDSAWAKGSQASEVGIATAALGPEVSSGRSAAQLANGYDRMAEAAIANSAARKSQSATAKTFDDRQIDQAYKSNAIIGGFPL